MKNLKEQLNLSATDLREARVNNFCESLEGNAKMMVTQLENKVRNLEDRREQLLDLGDDTSIAIGVRIKNVDGEALMKEVFDLGFQIKEAKRVLASVKEDYETLFGTSK